MPLIGWATVSASPKHIPTVLFGLVPWPHLPWLTAFSDQPNVEAVLKTIHRAGAYALIAVIVGHVGAALRHAVKGEAYLARMSVFGETTGEAGNRRGDRLARWIASL